MLTLTLTAAGVVLLVMRRQNRRAEAEANLWAEATDAVQ